MTGSAGEDRTRPVVLKRDLFGSIRRCDDAAGRRVVRDLTDARWWTRPLARLLARREQRALRRLEGLRGIPRLLHASRTRLDRDWIDGEPMQVASPRAPRYFLEAARLVRMLHARDVAHNDLGKEPNWLVTPDGRPAIVDFQLASVVRRRGRLFRALAYDDIRHLLKHKRTYLPERLTARERRILARRSLPSRVWMSTGKPVYRFVTRRLLGWADREGAGDRRL
jgi:RIO-like serine/threonine protein kinase